MAVTAIRSSVKSNFLKLFRLSEKVITPSMAVVKGHFEVFMSQRVADVGGRNPGPSASAWLAFTPKNATASELTALIFSVIRLARAGYIDSLCKAQSAQKQLKPIFSWASRCFSLARLVYQRPE